jgi:hypothetical protein
MIDHPAKLKQTQYLMGKMMRAYDDRGWRQSWAMYTMELSHEYCVP